MTRFYEDLIPVEPDRTRWTVVNALRSAAERQGDRTFLIAPEEDREWTFGQCATDAERVAGGLLARGAAEGDRVLIMAANSSAYVLSWLGCGFGHLVQVLINAAYNHGLLRHQVGLVGARVAVIDDIYAERFVAIRDGLPDLESFWVIDTGLAERAMEVLREAGWQAYQSEELLAGKSPASKAPDPRSMASIFFTSGTTGPSKGVAMPHSQMYFLGEEVIALTRLPTEDTYLTVTPLFHGSAQFMAAFPALIAGARMVVRSKFSASRWVDHLRAQQVTVTNLIGVMMDFIWKQPERQDDADNVFRCVYSAPTATSIVDGFSKRFGIEALVEAFGLTETCAPFISPYGEPRPTGATGLLARNWFDVKLVNPDTDEKMPVGGVGELMVRYKHPWICSLGYYGMPEKTVEACRNLWFHTGDAMRRDETGWYYFVDRYKDVLFRRGENISSYEVEQALLLHTNVLDCVVIGVADGVEAGEDGVLAVLMVGDPVDPAQLWTWCQDHVPAFAIPRYVRFVDELPKTPSQKVRRAVLRDAGITPDTFDQKVVQTRAR